MSHAEVSSTKRGVTLDQFAPGDLAYLFRSQYNRSLDEIDQLLQRQAFIRSKLGEQKASEIEKEADLHYNLDKFRIWQAQARFRALLTTLVAFPAAATILAGGRDGLGFAKRNRVAGFALFAGMYMTSFYVWHRIVGYNNDAYYEQNYAKNVKMLRNIIIRQ